MTVPKSSPYYSTLSFALLKLKEAGVIRRGLTNHLIADPNCKPVSIPTESLKMNKMAGLFAWILGAFGVTSIVLVFEIVFEKCHQRQSNDSDYQPLLFLLSEFLRLLEQKDPNLKYVKLKHMFETVEALEKVRKDNS